MDEISFVEKIGESIAHTIASFRIAEHTKNLLDESQEAADRVRGSKRAPGVERVTAPGERSWNSRKANGATVKVEAATLDVLTKLAAGFGVAAPQLNA